MDVSFLMQINLKGEYIIMKYNGMEFNLVPESQSELHITHHKEYKMEGIDSISTPSTCNPYCQKRQCVKGSVCEMCYAEQQLGCYKAMLPPLEKNAEILTSEIITDIPMFSSTIGRDESFGDLINKIQAINYMNIARFNKHVKFAAWSKNTWFWDEAIKDGWKKPKNLVIIHSSMMMNKRDKYDVIKKKYPYVDKIFTVYESEEKAKEDGVCINCQKKCFPCQACYKRSGAKYVNEIVKQKGFGSHKIKKNKEVSLNEISDI